MPGTSDFNDAVYGNFIWVALMILSITYVLLARVFRSLLLPLKAMLFNILSHRRGLGLPGDASGRTATARGRSSTSSRPAR